MKEEWRSAITTSGAQSVMITGPTLMPELSAGNLDTQHFGKHSCNFICSIL